ncbi:MAG: hypothetical protein KIT56_11015 [Gammaproteobacteria bacterium]|nr:hypothetical protein [Gammaproteobacteria bacterium]
MSSPGEGVVLTEGEELLLPLLVDKGEEEDGEAGILFSLIGELRTLCSNCKHSGLNFKLSAWIDGSKISFSFCNSDKTALNLFEFHGPLLSLILANN